jgi:hypothetical protein
MINTTTTYLPAQLIRIYCLPVVVIIGTILNMFSFLVMRRVTSTTSLYMTILSVTDTMFLLADAFNLWLLTKFNWSFIQLSSFSCKMLPFINNTMRQLSVLIIVIMTGEKLFAVAYPLEARGRVGRTKSLLIIFLLLILCLIANCHYLFTHSFLYLIVDNQSNSSTNMCVNTKWKFFYEKIWPFLDSTIYSFIPSILLSVFNFLIVISLIRAAKERSKFRVFKTKSSIGRLISLSLKNPEEIMTTNNIKRLSVPHCTLNHRLINKRISNKHINLEDCRLGRSSVQKFSKNETNLNKEFNNNFITAKLIFITISFMFMTMPNGILKIVGKRNEDNLFKAFAEILQYLNHTLNFVFYCISGRVFRTEAKRLFNFTKL